jgi:p-cumate 2,3-dioxygenase alpha subunit
MELKDIVVDDPAKGTFRVHRSSMTSPEIFALERERIFNRSWIYVGHESEVPNAGDYRRRNVAGRPVFFARGRDGQIRAFLNTCTHRGALICRQDEGNATSFQCFYHAWTFDIEGELTATPDEEGYAEGFDRGERALKQPRLDHYRGFYFITFSREAEDLLSYLGDVRLFMDRVIDQSKHGIKVVPGTAKYVMRANWKLLVENSMDGYHGMPTHKTYFDYRASQGVQLNRSGPTFGVAFPHGHAAMGRAGGGPTPYDYITTELSQETLELTARVRAIEAERYGEARAEWGAPGFSNVLIYPNLFIVGNTTLRTVWPLAPDLMEITGWLLAPTEMEGEQLEELVNDVIVFQGPGGFATPDDSEALESCQQGFVAGGPGEAEWTDISRGMHRAPIQLDELQMRTFWREWHAQVQGLPHAERTYDLQPTGRQPVAAGD